MHSTLKSIDNNRKSELGEGLKSIGLSFFSCCSDKILWPKQLNEERLTLSHIIVHHGVELKTAEAWSIWPYYIHGQKKRAIVDPMRGLSSPSLLDTVHGHLPKECWHSQWIEFLSSINLSDQDHSTQALSHIYLTGDSWFQVDKINYHNFTLVILIPKLIIFEAWSSKFRFYWLRIIL